MIQSYRNNANVSLVLGFWMSASAVGMRKEADAREAALGLAFVGLVAFTFGAVQYARSKGHSGWWGAFGIFGILGMIPLLLLSDRDVRGRTLRKADERFLFPSDERVVGAAHSVQPQAELEFGVQFGSALGVDGFGFVRDGRVVLGPSTLAYYGPRHWSVLARTGAFVVGTVALFFAVGVLSPLPHARAVALLRGLAERARRRARERARTRTRGTQADSRGRRPTDARAQDLHLAPRARGSRRRVRAAAERPAARARGLMGSRACACTRHHAAERRWARWCRVWRGFLADFGGELALFVDSDAMQLRLRSKFEVER
ncbi:MAG: hypothetical protein IPJ19_11455 [Planctomycetes bacterium]|nr:hypothetical protein [Planctomycetota bacterium]